MSRTKHWRDYRNALCILTVLTGVFASGWAQTRVVGPARYSITPAAPQPLPNGKSLKLNVLESFFRNKLQTTDVKNVSSAVISWTSSDPTTISVGSRGLAIAHQASGTATITATIRGVGTPNQISLILTAAPAVLVSISLTPFDGNVASVGGTKTYTATGHYSDSTTADLTSSATWSVVNNFAGSGGQATNAGATVTTTAAGTVKVTATDTASGIVGATYLNIGLSAISVTPASPSVPKGETQQFIATGTFTAGSPRDITNSVLWFSQDTTIAKMSDTFPACLTCAPGGIASTLAVGSAGIYATSGGISSSVPAQTLTVGPAVVTSVAISPSSCTPSNVPRGNNCQFTAVATYSDQTTATVTNSATWNSDNTNCATVSATGLATTLSSVPNPCTANISATFSVLSNSIGLTVTTHVLKSISISPANPTQPKGTPQQFTVRAHYTDTTVSVPNSGAGSPAWTSSSTSVATIGSSSGTANTTNSTLGTTTISATYSGFNASTGFSVTTASLNTITVTAVSPVPTTPPSANTTIPIGGEQQFQAIGNYSDGTHPDITSIVTWNSSTGAALFNDPDNPGLANGVSAGTPNITATLGSVTSSPALPLTIATINSITVSPASATINPGSGQPFTATANYAGSTQALATFGPTWSSNHTNVATVDQNGNATAVAAGSATISATLGAVSCTGINCGALTVNAAVLQSITVSCDPNNPCTGSGEPVLSLGQNEQMTATGHYSDGSNQDLTQNTHLTWTTDQPSIASIDSTGFLTTNALGSTTVRATCSSLCPGASSTVQGTMPLTVTF